MKYKISDICFQNELWINAFKNQVDGYAFGDPGRIDFRPITPIVGTPDGSDINRAETINGPSYTFTDEQKAALLEKEKP